MSIYYKQNFVSAQPLYAEVKEELSSYFSSGIIDDVMFGKWTEHCLKRFRKSAYRIEEVVLDVKDYVAELPCDFNSVREAWMCTFTPSVYYQEPNALYWQQDCRVDDPTRFDKCNECFDTETCTTDYLVTMKRTGTIMYRFSHTFLLRPANNHVKSKYCGDCCPNLHSEAADTFNIEDGKMITSYKEGKIHLIYYAETTDENLDQLVPDNFWVQDYIRKNLIYMCFRQICNRITDETFNQVEKKKQEAKQEQAVAFIIAETELKKQTSSEKIRQIKVLNQRNNMYRLPGDWRAYNHY